MPGKRYNLRILKGPWKGRRARIRGTGSYTGHWLVDIQGITFPDHGIPSLPWQCLKEIKQPTTKKRRARK